MGKSREDVFNNAFLFRVLYVCTHKTAALTQLMVHF